VKSIFWTILVGFSSFVLSILLTNHTLLWIDKQKFRILITPIKDLEKDLTPLSID